MALSKTQKEQIKAMALDGHTEFEICKAVGVSRGTVRKYKPLKNEQRELQNKQFIQNYTEVKKEVNDKWLHRLAKDDRQEQITDKILNLINDEKALQAEMDKGNMRNIVGAYKIMVETTISVKDMDLRDRQMSIRERELELKEMELKARIENPDAFTSVTIINDAPKPKDEVDYEYQPNPN